MSHDSPPSSSSPQKGSTPLMEAAKGGHADCVQLLMVGVFADAKDDRSNVPLPHIARTRTL
jgi:hypothetical protein